MASITIPDDIDAICREWYGEKWNDPKHAPGEKMKQVWYRYVAEILAAAESVRSAAPRPSCHDTKEM